MKKETSEFGKGFVYNLILFAEHFGKLQEFYGYSKMTKDKGMSLSLWMSTWFNGSSDHLYELEIPENLKKTKIGKMVLDLQNFVLEIGHGSRMMDDTISEKDVKKVMRITKDLGLLIDEHLGIKPIKAEWE